uniref:aECM cysteine-cradle domain-containing protein n=1 Tax=Strongyloides stercoralis TaxID=6248 RepID=A0A0K0E4H2_STRER
MPMLLVYFIFFLTINISINAQDNARFIDIRQIVRDTLDYVRTVPAPETFKNMIYNPTFQHTPQVAPVVNGQNLPIGPSVFAPPSKNDVDKLFHLPAEIFEKLASDAGYIKEPPRTYNYKENPQIVKNSKPTLGGFNFNIANENGKQQTMEEIIQQLQAQASSNKEVTNNIQIEPMTTTPMAIVDDKIKSEKMLTNDSKTILPYINDNLFNISQQLNNLLLSNQENEKKLNVTKNENLTENVLATTSTTPSFTQQPVTTTEASNVVDSNFDLQGQEIILNGKKYILTKPESIKNNEPSNNNLSKEKNSEKEEKKSSEYDTSSSIEKSLEKKISDNDYLSNENNNKSEEKSIITEDEEVSTTPSSDTNNEATLDTNPITRTVVSESGSFVQSEVVKDTENYQKPPTILSKSLENLLIKQLEKEQDKEDDEKKLLLKQRKFMDDDNLSSKMLINENDIKITSTVGPINIRKLGSTPKKGITKISSQKIKINETIENTTRPLESSEDKIELLRKSFNEQRRILAYKSRQLFTRNRLNKNPQPFLATTFCQIIKELSTNVGINNIVEFAEENCEVIKNYYPDLTCNEVLQYAEHCSLLMKLEKKN